MKNFAIDTDKFRIRSVELDDSSAMLGYRSDAIANQYQGWIPQNLQEVKAFVAKQPKKFNQVEKRVGQWQ